LVLTSPVGRGLGEGLEENDIKFLLLLNFCIFFTVCYCFSYIIVFQVEVTPLWELIICCNSSNCSGVISVVWLLFHHKITKIQVDITETIIQNKAIKATICAHFFAIFIIVLVVKFGLNQILKYIFQVSLYHCI
jgi:hypothetical protein